MDRTKSRPRGGRRGAPPDDRYMSLVRRFPLRPLRSDEDLDRAVAVIDGLLDQDDLAPDEADYLEVLGDLVKKYEAEAHPMPALPDADMLRHLIETRDTTQASVAAQTRISESTISEVLSGRRKLNRKHIEALAGFFQVSPAVFLRG
ncbi:MAG: helix-turn-helix domain-containing protein [Isosphaeraceae bacterium]